MDRFRSYTKFVNPGLGGLLELTGRDLRFVRAKGCVLEDEEGRPYDDWVSGFGSLNLGHNPDHVQDAIREFLQKDAPNLYVENLNPYSGKLGERLIELAGPAFETVFFCNSGSEAVEAGIKTAIAATRRPRIVYADKAWHGTTLGALSCMAKGPYREDFEGALAPFREVPFGDLGALERALQAGDVAAFLVEPIQVEAGVRIPEAAYLKGARELCTKHGALLIFDEVQTGLGRTGAFTAGQAYGVTPDLFMLAKSLGGGLVPIGATVIGADLWKRAYGGSYTRAELHNSTFGGNALACRAAMAALEKLGDTAFLRDVDQTGRRLFAALEKVADGNAVIERLSWKGLLGGLKLREASHPWVQSENLGLKDLEGAPASGFLFCERLARRGILVQVCAHDWSVVRVEPPLIVSPEACDRFVDAVADAVHWMEKNA